MNRTVGLGMRIGAIVVVVIAAVLVANAVVFRMWQFAAAGGCFLGVAVVIELLRRHWAETDYVHRLTGTTVLYGILGVALIVGAALIMNTTKGH
ncbi:MAG: hypothetical protein ACTH2Q_07985 [Propionibacteriaceae bacterium]